MESSINNIGKNQSEQARKEIEKKYGVVKAGSKQKEGFDATFNKAIHGKSVEILEKEYSFLTKICPDSGMSPDSYRGKPSNS